MKVRSVPSSVEVVDLTRIYKTVSGFLWRRRQKEILAVDHVSFSIERGELFGLLGPNGAGKTTTVKILATLLEPTTGFARVGGFDVVKEPRRVQERVNMVAGGERMLYFRLTGRENLRYFSDLYGVPRAVAEERIEGILKMVGLSGREDDYVEQYSKGMKQRLQIARGLVNDPQVLLLDEPTIGLDPHIARDLRTFVKEELVKKQGKTVLLTTHYMYEAEELCDRVAIIDKGRIVALDTPEKLKESVSREISLKLTLVGDLSALEAVLKKSGGITAYSFDREDTGEITATILAEDDRSVSVVVSEVLAAGLTVRKFETRKPTLEDAFIKLTSRGID